MSSGSRITSRGSICGCSRISLRPSSVSVITVARPTSEPVPAVVGMAKTGGIGRSSAGAVSVISKSQSGRGVDTARATDFPQSSPLPPPMATTASAACVRYSCAPAVTSAAIGSGCTSLKTETAMPASSSPARMPLKKGKAETPGSVTISTRLSPKSRTRWGNSAIRPGPARISVGMRQLPRCSILTLHPFK